MGEGRVSVIIPTYNYERFVVAAVESALEQSYRNLEILVVDDGSTDRTQARLAPYEGRIRYIYQDNRGLSAARNTGIRAARGDLIAFLDSDDLWHPDKLTVQVPRLLADPELAFLATDHWSMGTDEIDRMRWTRIDASQPLSTRPVRLDELLVGARFGSCGVLARRWCFDGVGLFDEELTSAEDMDMWVRIARRFPIAKLQLPLWIYRIHGINMHHATARMEANTLKVLTRALDAHRDQTGLARLRRQALASLATHSAYGYRDSHAFGTALRKLIQSFFIWPFSYEDLDIPYLHPRVRLRFLAVTILQAAKWHLGWSRPVHPEHSQASCSLDIDQAHAVSAEAKA